MNPIRRRLADRRAAARDARGAAYAEAAHDASGRLSQQLERFNRCWSEISRHVPYYAAQLRAGALPVRFDSWAEVLERLPVADRRFAQTHGAALADTRRPPDFQRMTGGSSAEPVQLPAWDEERAALDPDTWLGRSWYGIEPADGLFMIWGHSHLLGHGLRGRWNARKRQLQDALLGTIRFSAYDMSPAAMDRAARSLERSAARWVIGYSVALDRFARLREGRPLACDELKAVVATAEALPADDSESRLREVFQAPVAMEYGAVETGLVAHTRPEGGYGAFWLSYFLEAAEPGPRGGRVLRVTSLYPRCFPLLRYDLGDEVEAPDVELGATRFSRVLGRCNDYVELAGGVHIHSEAITHCVRGLASVQAFQLVQEGAAIELRVVPRGRLDEADRAGIRDRLARIHPDLGRADVAPVEQLYQTRAGKTPMILRR